MAEIAVRYPRLHTLELTRNTWITDLRPISALPLKSLTLYGSSQLSNIEPIASLNGLTFLDIGGDTPVSDLTPLTRLRKLQHLIIGNSTRSLDLTPISKLPKIRTLHMEEMTEDTDLSPLAGMHNLSISMSEGQQVKGIERLHPSTHIRWVPREGGWII